MKPTEVIMGSINVRRIDEETLERLRERARRHGISMEEEVRRTLDRAVASPDRLGDLAVSTFGPAHGIEFESPEHGPHEPVDLRR